MIRKNYQKSSAGYSQVNLPIFEGVLSDRITRASRAFAHVVILSENKNSYTTDLPDIEYDYFSRSSNGRQSGDEFMSSAEEDIQEETPDDKSYILCRQCLQVITSPAERIEMQESHEHTFANPAGILFQIGCFRSAGGCAHIGIATDQWSWFKGFSWRIAICHTCSTHLGWLYSSTSGNSFYGLILNRLTQSP